MAYIILLLLSFLNPQGILPPIMQHAPSGSYTPITCNNSSTHTGNDGGGDSTATIANYCTTGNDPSGYTISSLSIYIVTSSGNLNLSLYGNTTSGCYASAPNCANALLCTGTAAAMSSGVNTITVSGCGTIAASTVIWAAVQLDNNTATIGTGSASSATLDYYYPGTYGTWPNPFGGNNSTTTNFQLWATGTGN